MSGMTQLCKFTTKRGECTSPATRHILFSRDPDYVSWSCERHFARAVEHLAPRDTHTVGAACGVGKKDGGWWHYSTPEREGWCYIRGDDEVPESILELVGQSQDSEGQP